jgi:hypothetical protein
MGEPRERLSVDNGGAAGACRRSPSGDSPAMRDGDHTTKHAPLPVPAYLSEHMKIERMRPPVGDLFLSDIRQKRSASGLGKAEVPVIADHECNACWTP